MALEDGSAASDELEYKHDCGDDQQQMDQTTAYAADQSQQPEHNKYR